MGLQWVANDPDCGIEDIDKIAEMVVLLTPEEIDERAKKYGLTYAKDIEPETLGKIYTCKYWDEGTMLCKNYENRPSMCRKFPYEEPCPYGCDHVEKNTEDG